MKNKNYYIATIVTVMFLSTILEYLVEKEQIVNLGFVSTTFVAVTGLVFEQISKLKK